MKKLEGLVTRVRRIGFGRSYDVGAALYYRLECEHWIELHARRSEVVAKSAGGEFRLGAKSGILVRGSPDGRSGGELSDQKGRALLNIRRRRPNSC